MEILEQGIALLKKIPKSLYLPFGLGCIGLILFIYGIGIMFNSRHSRENNAFIDFSQEKIASNSALQTENSIVIDVEGSVVSPGVYHVASQARIQDALVAAGGLSGNADRQWVAQHINLATKLSDGTKIYIPSYAEASEGQASNIGNPSTVLGAQSQQIDINSANESDLDSLSGVGSATANKIIAGRPYASTQELLSRKIVSAKVFEKIKDLITAN